MKKILIVLLASVALQAQVGDPPQPIVGVTTGTKLKWEHTLQTTSGVAKAPSGYIIYHSTVEADLGTVRESSLAIVDPSLLQDPTNQNIFRYLAVSNPDLVGKTLFINMVAYYSTPSGRVDSDRSATVSGMFIEKPAIPLAVTIE